MLTSDFAQIKAHSGSPTIQAQRIYEQSLEVFINLGSPLPRHTVE